MEVNSNTVWLVVGVLMIGPFLLLVASLGVVLWARSWWSRAERAVAQTQALGGQAQRLLDQLGRVRDEYAAVGRDAYTRMAGEIDQAGESLAVRMGALPGLLGALERAGQNRPEGGLPAALSFWQTANERRRLCIDLEYGREALASQMGQARAVLQKMEARPIEIKVRIQAARENISRLEQILAELHGLGLGGWEEAAAGLKQVRELSLQIPVALSENSGLPRADLFALTAHGIEILDALEPPLEQWLREASNWSGQYQAGKASLERILQNLTHLRAVTSAAPPLLLDISSFIIHLSQLEERVRAQYDLFQTSSVQDLGRHVRAAARFENTLRASSEEHDRACLEALNLERKLAELDAKYAVLESGQAGRSLSEYVFDRDQSRARLDHLDLRIDTLRPFEAKLLPGAVTAKVSLADELGVALQNLEKEMKQRRERFDELAALLQSSDLQSGPVWIETARFDLKTAQETRNEGWSWRAKTDSLLRSLDGMEVLQARVVAAALPVTIRESELDGQLEQAHRLADLHRKTRAQVAQVLRSKNVPSA